ncbi:TetR/AcrR family transcriptional regulator [Enterococcus sp. AZ103]|uniref:TetR/AcrR family transcriptional regulator n=1 Tax=Enterococcus sp. AZ103 TaxID=2774628 RepID=UPI003F21B45C
MTHTKDFDQKRSEILDCAQQLFISKSYELTSVNMILNEVGIAKGTFYYYFNSKEEVMDAVIMRIVLKDLAYAKEILARKDLSALEKLLTTLFTKPETDEKKNIVKELHQANNALMKQRALQRTIELICPIYAEIIAEGNAQNEFSSSQPLADSQFLVAGVQSLLDLSNLKDSKIEIKIENIVNILFTVLNINQNNVDQQTILNKIKGGNNNEN